MGMFGKNLIARFARCAGVAFLAFCSFAGLAEAGSAADSSSKDASTTVFSAVPGLPGTANASRLFEKSVTVGVFDMNGHYAGLSTQGLPQGLYIVRQKVQGRAVNRMFVKK